MNTRKTGMTSKSGDAEISTGFPDPYVGRREFIQETGALVVSASGLLGLPTPQALSAEAAPRRMGPKSIRSIESIWIPNRKRDDTRLRDETRHLRGDDR